MFGTRAVIYNILAALVDIMGAFDGNVELLANISIDMSTAIFYQRIDKFHKTTYV
jgi:hypothetical protein